MIVRSITPPSYMTYIFPESGVLIINTRHVCSIPNMVNKISEQLETINSHTVCILSCVATLHFLLKTFSKVKVSCSTISFELNTSLAAKGALAHRLQRRTACKTQNGRQGAPKWQRGSGKVSTPRFLGVPVDFR